MRINKQNIYFWYRKRRRLFCNFSFTQQFIVLLFCFIFIEIFASKCTFKENNLINNNYFKQIFSFNLSSSFNFISSQNVFNLSNCACKQDWTDAFCSRAEKYSKINSLEKAPSICICRKLIGINKCVQFISRCFRRSFMDTGQINNKQNRPQVLQEKCSCCFNQPDAYCKQLECNQMYPIFEQISNTTCQCFIPQLKENYQQKILKKYLNLFEYLCEDWNGKSIDENEEEKLYSSSSNLNNFQHSTKENKNLNNLFYSSAPYARFLSFLLIVLVGSFILAIAACVWGHWRRQHLRKKAEIKLNMEQINIGRDQQLLQCEEEDNNLNKNGENGTIYQEVTV